MYIENKVRLEVDNHRVQATCWRLGSLLTVAETMFSPMVVAIVLAIVDSVTMRRAGSWMWLEAFISATSYRPVCLAHNFANINRAAFGRMRKTGDVLVGSGTSFPVSTFVIY